MIALGVVPIINIDILACLAKLAKIDYPVTMSLTHNTINFWHFQAPANFLTTPNIVFNLMFEIYGVGPPTESQCEIVLT